MRKLKLFLSLLMVMLLSIGQMWGADPDESITFSEQGYSNPQAVTSVSGTYCTITFDKGTNSQNAPKYYASGTSIRAYGGNTFTVSSSTKTIAKIELGFGSSDGSNAITTDVDTYDNGTWTGSATSITFTIGGTSGNRRLASVAVTYEEEDTPPTPTCAAPTFDPEDGEKFDESIDVEINAEDGATIYYTTDGNAPTTSSSVYSTALHFTETTTLKAMAVKAGSNNSAVATATYTKMVTVPGYAIDFESELDAYVDWESTNIGIRTSTITAHGGTYYGSNVNGNGNATATAAIKTKAKVATPGVLTFYISKESKNTTASSWKAQVSADGSEWTDVETFDAKSMSKGAWNECTADLSEYSNVYVRIYYEGSNAIRAIDDIELAEAAAVAKPAISGETPFLTSTTVTLAQAGADHIYYTTNGDAPTTSSAEYTGSFSLTETTTVKAIAVKGSDESGVAEQTFTKATVLTVAQALETAAKGDNKYAKGIIYAIDEVSTQHGNATYYLKDEGQENSIKIYRGKYLGNVNFTAEDQIYEGDEVTVFGTISEYSSANQFAQGNYIVALKPAARLSWSEATFDAEIEGENTFPGLTNTNGVTVAYSSSNTDAATINPSTGEISLVAVGQTTITASFAGNDTYKAKNVSYTLNVKNSVIRADISFEEYGGSEVADLTQQTNLPNPLPVITKAGKNFGGWYTTSNFEDGTEAVAGAAVESTDEITLFAKWLDPYTVAVAKTVIGDNTVGIANQYVAGIISQVDEYNSKYNSITYWISADGGTIGDQLQVYSGLIGNAAEALEKENFSSVEDLKVGDIVVVTGSLKKYGDVYEFDKNNTIYSFTRPVAQTYSITYVENGANEDIDDDDAATNLPNPLPTVTKSGKVFGGWWTTSTFEDGSQAVAGAQLSDDVILYAKWNDLSQWAYTYTSNIALAVDENDTKAYAEKVKITVEEVLTEFPALRAATGSAAGTCHVIVPAGTQTLHFHAAAWNNKTSTLTVKMGETTLLSQALTADAGINTNSPYTLEGNAYEYYYSIDLSSYNLTEETRITFSAASGKQSVIFGVNQEGGILPVLESIEIKGDLNTKTGYKAGNALDLEGLTVEATYSLAGVNQTPVDITNKLGDGLTLTYDPLVENQTEVTITATYGDKSDDITITGLDPVASADPKIYVSTLNVNFASVEVGESVPAAKTVTVNLTNIASVTATLGGTNPEAFGISKTEGVVDGDEITISILANTDAAASYSATLTISDGEGGADDKTINLSFAVTEPVVEDDVTGTWTLVTNATTLAAGKKVIIAQYVEADGAINTMAGQASNNRSVIASTVAGTTLTPAIGTKVMTLADAGEGNFYLKTSDGEYLYNASTSGKSYLRTKAEEENVSWTIAVDAEGVATITSVENTNRTKMRYNPNTSGSPLFNCYASGQENIALYMLEEDTPEPPVVNYTEVRNGLTEGWYYTMCLDKAVTAVKAGSIWRVLSKAANGNDVILEEVTGTLDAGRPYIFRAAASTLEVAYTGDAVGAPVNDAENNGLIGSFTEEPLAQNSNHYIIYNNALYYVNSDNVKVGAHRAYLDMTGVPAYSNEPQQGNAPRRRVTMAVYGEQTTTGIDALNAAEAPVKVMINGQMYILRGEKMYDATGRLVK